MIIQINLEGEEEKAYLKHQANMQEDPNTTFLSGMILEGCYCLAKNKKFFMRAMQSWFDRMNNQKKESGENGNQN